MRKQLLFICILVIFLSEGLFSQQITEIEYFLNNDPGIGNGFSVSFSPDTIVETSFIVDLSSVNPGINHLFIRAKDNYGHWSLHSMKTFYVVQGFSITPDIVDIEYYWDNDPGFGLAASLPCLPPNDTIQANYHIPLSNLTLGDHYLFIRAKDDDGRWSLHSKDTVNIKGQLPSNISIQNATINNSQTECYNASNTITVAGSSTTVDILSGGDVAFIAGENILFKPGFNAHQGCYINARITTNGEYCSSQPMIPGHDKTFEYLSEDVDIFKDEDIEYRIYPNPTSGHVTIDFKRKIAKTDVRVLNFQGSQMIQLEYNNSQGKVEFDISSLPAGIYIIVIITRTQLITRKIIKAK